MKNFKTFEAYLNSILESRQLKNPAYTVSAFARQLNLPASRLSEILKGKIGISVKRAIEIADILKLAAKDKDHFVNLVQAAHDRNPLQRQKAQEKVTEYYETYEPIDSHKISNWYHLALIELITISPELSASELALKLNLSEDITDRSLAELLSMNVIEANKDNNGYNVLSANRETAMDMPSESVKQLNEQVLAKAAIELRAQDVSNRDFSIAFFAMNKDQLKMAKERIKQFRRDLMKEFESAPHKDAVYCMSTQFFELTNTHTQNKDS